MTADSPIIVALDYPEADQALAMAERLDPARVRVKVGKELFTRAGPAVVEALRQRGFEVFLDLKFHDIPNTVAGAVRAAADLGVWMVNVHASGGGRMMDAAREALANCSERPRLIAVTVLTSQTEDDLREIGVTVSAEEQVRRLALLTRDHGLDGVVCSAREAPMLREICGADFDLVTPGIRPAGSAGDDQRRVVTPARARELGVSHMVIGRPITRAQNPTAVVDDILQSLT
ncbi:orotidine-5'-phosphate decarboxylase [Alloalcanivorax gelatiniphagus]|uniref:Orotidine 5'-phosphate decarboxylase n=1 Tax=Alloalcanivorax gelatiniphagus TaxID=1194167 RepID=A0ABY2XP71_9GAMM|nr:orotidine-5'-phosphate decarboxylase [Alloalcanivorax gelatiniphagus]TMW13390.1 orotidine-5'-phosphate decarboxylase [Alloalcanivorax gelatiniphagus]